MTSNEIFALLLTAPHWVGGYIVLRSIEAIATWAIKHVRVEVKK